MSSLDITDRWCRDLKKGKLGSEGSEGSEVEGEGREDGYTQYSGNSQDSTAKSNPHSMDSGIATRSTRSGHHITLLYLSLTSLPQSDSRAGPERQRRVEQRGVVQ